MEFRTIEAKRGGVCNRCKAEFPPGTRIRWAARQGSYHLSAECPATVTTDVTVLTVQQDELRLNVEVVPQRVVCANRLPDADQMLAAFGVKS